jgi:hypothetical protein
MRIWAVVILLAFLVPVVAVTAANATRTTHTTDKDHPSTGHGMITFTQTGTVSGPTKVSDHTTITVVDEKLAFSGNLSGSAVTIEREVIHTFTDEGKTITFTTFYGSGNFTGTLGGNTVTLHIRYEGVMNSTFSRGNFVVSSDTQTTGVHGEGHFKGTLTTSGEGGGSSGVNYTMHWNVTTHTEHEEARDEDRDRD